jgi:hypothetical protein
MQLKKKIICLGILSVTVAFTGKKENAPATDYRDAYVGNYTCIRTHTDVNDSHTALVTSNTSGVITIAKDVADSMMLITTGDNQFTLKFVAPNLISTQSTGIKWGKFFATDSILITYIPSKMAPGSFIYRGKKS